MLVGKRDSLAKNAAAGSQQDSCYRTFRDDWVASPQEIAGDRFSQNQHPTSKPC